jgi:hypothetical protein
MVRAGMPFCNRRGVTSEFFAHRPASLAILGPSLGSFMSRQSRIPARSFRVAVATALTIRSVAGASVADQGKPDAANKP